MMRGTRALCLCPPRIIVGKSEGLIFMHFFSSFIHYIIFVKRTDFSGVVSAYFIVLK